MRASLVGSIGWRASLAAACRAGLRGLRAGLGRASAGSSLTAGIGTRPPVAGGKCMARRSRYIRASLLGSIGWRASSGRGRRRLALAPEQLALRLAVLAHSEADGVVRRHSVAVHRLHHHVDHRPAPLVVVLHDLPFLENVVRRYRRWLDTARRAIASCRLRAI